MQSETEIGVTDFVAHPDGRRVRFAHVPGMGMYAGYDGSTLLVCPAFANGTPDFDNIGEPDVSFTNDELETIYKAIVRWPAGVESSRVQYSSELAGNVIWEPDSNMDDGMSALMWVTDSMFHSDGTWNTGKLREVAGLLTKIADKVDEK